MPKYQCPECEAVLRRETPVPEGKKIRCPKCEFAFKPKPLRESEEDPDKAKKKAKVAQKSKPVDDDDEELGGSYEVVKEKEDTADEKKKKKVDYGSLRDKFKKTKRGPAMAKVVGTTNGMLLIGIVLAITSLIAVMGGLWPFIFTPDGQGPKGANLRVKLIIVFSGVVGFFYGGCVCYGGSKFHDLRSYSWSMAAAIMSVVLGIGGGIGLLITGISIYDQVDEGIVVMLFYMGMLLGLASAAFSCMIGVKSLGQLKDEDIKEAFVETSEMRDY